MCQEMPPDSRRPLDTFYDEDMGRLQTYSLEVFMYTHIITHFDIVVST
jgi:hypothetical protein